MKNRRDSKKFPWLTCVAVLTIVIGLTAVAYPFFVDLRDDQRQRMLLSEIDRIALGGAPAERTDEAAPPTEPSDPRERLLRGDYRTANGSPVIAIKESADPLESLFSQGEEDDISLPDMPEYDPAPEVQLPENVLKLELVGRIRLDRLGINLPIVEGCGKKMLKYAVGHMQGTAMPGQTGNVFLAGHRASAYGRMFNRLGEVEYGDRIVLADVNGVESVYIVDQMFLVDPNQRKQIIDVEPGEFRVTLQTCHPLYHRTYRLIVRATMLQAGSGASGDAALPTMPLPRANPPYALDEPIEHGTPTREPKGRR